MQSKPIDFASTAQGDFKQHEHDPSDTRECDSEMLVGNSKVSKNRVKSALVDVVRACALTMLHLCWRVISSCLQSLHM